MVFVKRISRKKANTFKYEADEPCKEAEGTILSDWMVYWENEDSIEPDVTVCLEDCNYRLHSCVLRFWSTYFDKMLVNHEPDSCIMLREKQCYFECVRQFMYNGVLPIDNTNFMNVLSIANDLEISSIVKFCSHMIISSLRENIFDIAEVLEFLCEPGNQYSSKIIIPQLVRRWDIIQSNEFLRNTSFEALKIIITSNAIPRFDDGAVLNVCCQWISLDISRRFRYVLKILQCVTGKSNDPYLLNFNPECVEPKNIDDIKNLFSGLLEFSIKKGKIDFLNSFGLAIKKGNDQTYDEVNDEPVPSTQQLFYFQEWSSHMKALRHNKLSGDNIIVQVRSSQEYLLDYWVLSLSSEFFRSLDPNLRHYVQLDLTDEEFTSVLDFMYGKELHITQDNIINLLQASCFLKMHSCKQLILQYIRKNISSLNLLELLNDSFGQFKGVYNFVKRQIVKNFADVKKYSIYCLKFDCLKALISSKTLKLDTKERLSLCYDWVTHDIKKRYFYVSELMAEISLLDRNLEALSEKFYVQLRKKYYSDVFSFHDHEELQFGRTFRINLPRIDSAPYKTTKVPQKKTQLGKPFCILVPRL